MNSQLNANIGSVSKEITAREGKRPFFVISARDINVMDTAPDSDKWVTIFVGADSAEKLVKLHAALKVGHYINVVGRPGANLNVYEGKVAAQKTLNATPGSVTLMGAPLGTGKPSQDGTPSAPAADSAAQTAGQTVAVGAGAAADLPEDEVGF
jgi:hypothetical protein